MEEDQRENISTMRSKIDYLRLTRFILGFLTIVVVGFFIIAGWYWYGNYAEEREANEQYQNYLDVEARYTEAMMADTYGGETPQETLDMFVEALRADDLELAAKYFVYDESLSRKKWEEALFATKEAGKISEVVADLSRAEASPQQSSSQKRFQFVVINSEGMAEATVYMFLNKHSNTWKIENL